jgi:hypothetical protein
MNDTEIEKLLRKTPRVKMPAGLAERLEGDIRLAPRPRPSAADSRLFWKRWLPALSFGVLILGCLVAIGVQSNVLVDLRRQNNNLRAAGQDLEQLRQENAEYQRLVAENRQLDQLRRDNEELEKLRVEIAQLREQAQQLAQLRAENEQLLAQQKAIAAGAAQEEDPFGAAKAKAESTACINNLKQIGLGARLWANDNHDILPRDFLTMSNELNTPKILVCPSDEGRTRAIAWDQFGPANVSYQFLAPGLPETAPPTTIMTRCPVHGHVGLIDGSVHGGAWKFAVQREGRWLLERRN